MRLNKPKRYRHTMPRCCASCKYFVIAGNVLEVFSTAFYQCKRDPENIQGGWNDLNPENHICDGYKKQ